MICPECNGKKWVREWIAQDELGPVRNCPKCNGTGEVPEESNQERAREMLVHLAKKYGHTGDYLEVQSFVQFCCEDLGMDIPTDDELEPYEESSLLPTCLDWRIEQKLIFNCPHCGATTDYMNPSRGTEVQCLKCKNWCTLGEKEHNG